MPLYIDFTKAENPSIQKKENSNWLEKPALKFRKTYMLQ